MVMLSVACTSKNKSINSVATSKNMLFSDSIKYLDDNFDNLTESDIKSIDLYCFCYNDSDSKWIGCSTFVRVSPESLIEPDRKLDSITDKSGCTKFLRLIKTDYKLIDTIQGHDVRLVALINTKSKQQKTLSICQDSTLCYQDKYLIKYNRQTSKIFREAFKLNTIHCE